MSPNFPGRARLSLAVELVVREGEPLHEQSHVLGLDRGAAPVEKVRGGGYGGGRKGPGARWVQVGAGRKEKGLAKSTRPRCFYLRLARRGRVRCFYLRLARRGRVRCFN